jgi:ABC-type spermidine/putrescine transport system permease subunit I
VEQALGDLPERVSVQRSRLWSLLAIPGLLWLIAFFLFAFYAIVSVGLGNVDTLYQPLPHWNPVDWNVGYLIQAVKGVVPGGATWGQVVRTLAYIALAVAVSLGIGYPVAWYASRYAGRWKVPLLVALVLPFWISYLMRMFAWTTLLESDGYAARVLHALSIDRGLESIGLLQGGDWLAGQHVTVVLGLVYGYVPYLILPLFATLDRIDGRLIEAARDLGASPVSAFWRVVWPLSRTGTLAGIVIIALPMFGDYFTADLLSGSPRTSMLGNAINTSLLGGPTKPFASALTLILSAFLLVLMLGYLRQLRSDQREALGT